MYIVCWTDRIEGKFIDHWNAYDEHQDALADYELLLSYEDTWSASLCNVAKSTDYEVTV
jgi:hypothetical protein